MLKFHPRFNAAILSGEKTTTARLEMKAMPEEVRACVNPNVNPDKYKPFAWIRIKKITRMDINLVDYRNEGFVTMADFIWFLEAAYQTNLTSDSQVYVIHFERVEDPNGTE